MTTTRIRSRLARELLPTVGLTVAGVLVAAVAFLPLFWAFTSSLRPGPDIFRYLNPLSWSTFFSKAVTFENYLNLAETPMGRGIVNSLAVSLVTVAVGLLVCSLAAFAFAVMNFPGREVLFGVTVLSFMIPFDAIAIPLATLFRDWDLQNTYVGLILPGIGDGIAIFLLRQFFLAIPFDLVEAGRLDGLSWWGVYRRIYLPLSPPALIGAGLTIFLFQWHAFVWPLLIGTDSEHILGPIALANFQGQFSVDHGLLFAGAVVLTVIPLVLILVLQRHFVRSVSTSGLR